MTDLSLADAAERSRALLPSRSFIIQAPAGAGKTELLVRRFLVLLGVVRNPEEIVAITFTRKAAAEMRERVLGAMQAVQAGRSPGTAAAQERYQLAAAALQNDHRHGWQLLQHPSRLRIQTIDGLCASLVRQMPWLSRLGGPMRVCEDTTALYRAAALDTIKLLADDQAPRRAAVAILLRHVDNRLPRAVELLTSMLQRRDQWLRHLGAGGPLPRAVLERAWSDALDGHLAAVCAELPPESCTTLGACARYAAHNLSGGETESAISAWGDSATLPPARASALPRWQGLAELLLTAGGAWRKQVNRRQGFPADRTPQAAAMKQRMQALLTQLQPAEGLRRLLREVRDLPPPVYTDPQWQVLEALTLLLPLAAARLDVLFGECGMVDFQELNRRANLALGDVEVPSDLALRLDYRIQHLLVDEFQDTSYSQLTLLERLTAGWLPDDGRSLFLVGDPMQSIYRFREAEVGIFLRVAAAGIGALRPELLRLKVNFRSEPAVVDWVNDAVGGGFPQVANADRGAVCYEPGVACASGAAGAGVYVHSLVDAEQPDEARCVVDIVRQVQRRRPQARLAVLVRARGHLQHITAALEQAGLDYAGVDLRQLSSRSVIQDLLALVWALLFPADRLSWLAVLRAPWCGLGLRDLERLVTAAGDCGLGVFLDSDGDYPELSADGLVRLRRFQGVMAQTRERRRRHDLCRLAQGTWERLGGPACITAEELADAERFWALLAEHSHGGRLADPVAFRDALDGLWAQPAPEVSERLQLMTLHKAKGLEFDTVIIPGLERRAATEVAALLLWEELASGLLLAPLGREGDDPDMHFRYLRRLTADKQQRETQRLLYVGCTRAQHALHLIGSVRRDPRGGLRPPPQGSLLQLLWPAIGQQFQASSARQLDLFRSPAGAGPLLPLRRLPTRWQPPAPAPAVLVAAVPPPAGADGMAIEYSWVGAAARQVGILVHETLQRMAQDGLNRWPAARLHGLSDYWYQRLAAAGVAPAERSGAVARTRAAVTRVLRDPRAAWLFDPAHEAAHNEYAVSTLVAGQVRHLRIDRTFVTDGVRWIIDFKTSTHEGAGLDEFLDRERQRYHPQLTAYARALAQLDNRPIRLGLYFPLLGGWREWPYADA